MKAYPAPDIFCSNSISDEQSPDREYTNVISHHSHFELVLTGSDAITVKKTNTLLLIFTCKP
jgi:hypothetical protein